MPVCNFCKTSNESLLTCGCCGKVSYCNRECQARDWRSHKSSCPPYTIKEVPGKGRGMFATRKIKPGQIIIEKLPILTALTVHFRVEPKTGDNSTKAIANMSSSKQVEPMCNL